MSPRTTFLSRLLGLYFLLVALAMFLHKQVIVDTVVALVHSAPLLFFFGIVALLAGLAMILSHNIWTGGALPVIVTLLGWMAILKGLLFLLLTPNAAAGFYLGTLHYAQFFYFYVTFCLILGAYLTYGGFKTKPSRRPPAPSKE